MMYCRNCSKQMEEVERKMTWDSQSGCTIVTYICSSCGISLDHTVHSFTVLPEATKQHMNFLREQLFI